MINHAKLAPSAAHRWMRCPGWARKVSTIPPTPSSEAAIDGTHTHTMLEKCLTEDIQFAKSLVDLPMQDHEGKFTPDEERAKRVQVVLDYIKTIKEKAPCNIISESKIDIGGWWHRDDLFGTADLQLVTHDIYEIVDLKDGYTPVSPDTPQLKLYAFGGMMEYSNHDPKQAVVPFKTIRCTIIQPRLSDQPNSVDFTPEELMNWIQDEVIPATDATDDPNAPLVPGDWCKWCNASGNCEAQAIVALGAAQVMFQDTDKQMELAEQSAGINIGELSDDKIRQILEAKPLLLEFLSGVETEAFRRFNIGQPIPGMKIVYSGRGHVKWKNDLDIEKALLDMKVPKNEIYKQVMITPTQAKSLKWTNRKGQGLSLTERQIRKIEEDLTIKGTGEKMIVPESDKRTAINTDAKAMFAGVETTPELPDWMK